MKTRSDSTAPVRESLDLSTPSTRKINIFPPILSDPDDDEDDSLIALSRPKNSSAQNIKKQRPRRFLGFRVPRRYRDYTDSQLLILLLLSTRGLGCFLSLMVHLGLFIILALVIFQVRVGTLGTSIDATFDALPAELGLVETAGDQMESERSIESNVNLASTQPNLTSILESTPTMTHQTAGSGALKPPEPVSLAQEQSELSPQQPNFARAGLTKGRTRETRQHGLPGRKGDTNRASEDAVERGLAWLAAHQMSDGGWSFDLHSRDRNGRENPCNGKCSNTHRGLHHDAEYRTGLHPSRTAATGMALLPFLGAGYTHTKVDAANPYQRTVERGLEFLKYSVQHTDQGYDYRQDYIGQGMYIQGIVVLALCEAYEMTGDPSLRLYAQEGLRFIESAQRPDGGWRYHTPKDTDFIKDISSDTPVTGWQVMALKSGLSAELNVRPSVLYQVDIFLRLVKSRDGSLYHYLPIKNESSEEKMTATTAIGTLLRLYLGASPEEPSIRKGLSRLAQWIERNERDWKLIKRGERLNGKRELSVGFGERNRQLFIHNLYFSFYAALTLQNVGGPDWHRSYAILRDFLIETQQAGGLVGHEKGSWLFHDIYLNDGGRLLNTSLAILILETPYRYLPLFE